MVAAQHPSRRRGGERRWVLREGNGFGLPVGEMDSTSLSTRRTQKVHDETTPKSKNPWWVKIYIQYFFISTHCILTLTTSVRQPVPMVRGLFSGYIEINKINKKMMNSCNLFEVHSHSTILQLPSKYMGWNSVTVRMKSIRKSEKFKFVLFNFIVLELLK